MAFRGVIRDGAFVLAGQVASAAGILANVRLLTEFLDPRAYGLMVLIVGIASTATAVMVWPLGQAALVTFAQFKVRGSDELFRQIVLFRAKRLITGLAVTLSSVGVLVTWLTADDWLPGAFLGALFALEAGRYVSMTLMMAAREQRLAAAIYASDAWLRFLCTWLALRYIQPSVSVAMFGTAAGAALLMLALRLTPGVRAWRTSRPDAGSLTREIEEAILSRARPLIPSSILTNVAEMTGRYVVAWGAGLGSAGIYSAAVSLIRRPFGMLNSVTDWSLKPAVATAVAAGETPRTVAAMRAWLLVGVGSALLLAVAIVIARDPIVRLLLAAEYRSAAALLPWIVAGMLFLNTANVLNGIALVLGNAKVTLASSAAGAVATVAATFVLVTRDGIRGGAIAIAVAYGCQVIVSAILAVRRYRDAVPPIARRATES